MKKAIEFYDRNIDDIIIESMKVQPYDEDTKKLIQNQDNPELVKTVVKVTGATMYVRHDLHNIRVMVGRELIMRIAEEIRMIEGNPVTWEKYIPD